MYVAHTFEVLLQAKVAAVVHLGDVEDTYCCRIDRSPNPKPRPYLHLWGGVGVVFLCLIPPDLRLEHGGGASRHMWCC